MGEPLVSARRLDAFERGRVHYVGRPCKYGHGAEAGGAVRYTQNASCRECARETSRRQYQAQRR